MGADDGEQAVLLEEVAAGGVSEGERAAPHLVVAEILVGTLEVDGRVGPQQVAHGAEGGRLSEPFDLLDILQGTHLWTEPAVNTEELLVHNRGQRQAVERFHAGGVHWLCILHQACREREYLQLG